MAELRSALARTPLGEVHTYIQSGNVLVHTELKDSEVEHIVRKTIRDNFGGDLVVISRTPRQLQRMLDQHPFGEEETSRMYFTALGDKPARQELDSFATIDFSPDNVQLVGNTIYTLYATKLSDSKFHNNFFERKLGVTATTRNWNTMTALIERSHQVGK